MSVRVRYAPSPTGLQHIGGIRTLLFNYFYAHSHGGRCILRIEDTDQTRFDFKGLMDIFETLSWMGLRFDEGPGSDELFRCLLTAQTSGNRKLYTKEEYDRLSHEYIDTLVNSVLADRRSSTTYIQSSREHIYRHHAQLLLANGKAYKCFCRPERLSSLREIQKKKVRGAYPTEWGYDRNCRTLKQWEIEKYEAQETPFVIRFKGPLEGETLVNDELLGQIRHQHRDISPDPVLLKSDGLPTYHLASVIDDHLMEISHVIRAQEWLSSAALHVLLYEAFGWSPPIFIHLPMVLGKDGQKLSKRHGSTSLQEFRREGYLPEAIINYVSMLGWSHSENIEFFTMNALEKCFAKGTLNRAAARFDYKKLQWYNVHYIQRADHARLVNLCRPYLIDAGLLSDPATDNSRKVSTGVLSERAVHYSNTDNNSDIIGSMNRGDILYKFIPLAKKRMRTLADISKLAGFLFTDKVLTSASDLLMKKQDAQQAIDALMAVQKNFFILAALDDTEFHAWFEKTAENYGGLGQLMMPLRMALTGSKASPPLIDCIQLLGTEESLRRIDNAIRLLEAN